VSDRLDELRGRRALLKEQLDRIEREIAALEAAGQPPRIVASARPDESEAEAILREYAQPAASIERRTTLGCVLYLGLLLALIALGLGAIYLHARAARGH
jgi:hypothetical protein